MLNYLLCKLSQAGETAGVVQVGAKERVLGHMPSVAAAALVPRLAGLNLPAILVYGDVWHSQHRHRRLQHTRMSHRVQPRQHCRRSVFPHKYTNTAKLTVSVSFFACRVLQHIFFHVTPVCKSILALYVLFYLKI